MILREAYTDAFNLPAVNVDNFSNKSKVSILIDSLTERKLIQDIEKNCKIPIKINNDNERKNSLGHIFLF